MPDKEEKTCEKENPLWTMYTIGILGFTATSYASDGFWVSLLKSLIWPIAVALWLVEKFK